MVYTGVCVQIMVFQPEQRFYPNYTRSFSKRKRHLRKKRLRNRKGRGF
jgi:hypothetical protein